MASFLSTLAKNVGEFGRQAKQSAQSLLSLFPSTSKYSAPTPTPSRPAPSPTSAGGGVSGGGGGGGGGQPSLSNQANNALIDELSRAIIELEDKLNNIPGVYLSDEEKESFLQKAIAQVAPYYDKKRGEIEKSIQTGKIRSAEDVLLTIRDVTQEAQDLLKRYDIEEAKTEEEFVNTMADITATEAENLAFKQDDWRQRIKNVKQGQVESGVLTSGIGMKEVRQLLNRQQMEETAIGRRAGQARTETETGRTYDMKKIGAAREEVERERVRRVGGPGELAETTGAALETTGIPGMEELPSRAEIARRRGEDPYTQYKPESLTDLTEEQTRARESRKLQLQAEELAIRGQREASEEKAVRGQISKKIREREGLLLTGSYA